MQLKTILNRVTDYKSFVFGKTILGEESTTPTVEVEVKSRANGRPICSGCGKVAPGYDTMPECRRFEFIPIWGMMVYFMYRMRRVNCPDCGVKVEQVPWVEGKSPMTIEYRWYLAKWAWRMSWKPDGKDATAILSLLGQGADQESSVHLQRHVARLPEGNRQEGEPRDPRTGPLSCDAADQQGDQQSPCRGGETIGGGRLSAALERWSLGAAETASEPNRKASRQAEGASSLQPQERPQLSDARRFSAFLGVLESGLGRQVFGPVVHSCDAEQN